MIFNNLCASAKNKIEEEKTKTTSKVQETTFSDDIAYGESPKDCPVKKFIALCGVSKKDVKSKNGTYTIPLFYRGQFVNTLGNIDSTYYLFSSDMKNNEDITTIVVPEGIEAIGNKSLYANLPKNLTKIILPKSIKALTYGAFYGNSNDSLNYTIDISNLEDCQYYGAYCFYYSKNLEGGFDFDKNMENLYLGEYAFYESNFFDLNETLTIPNKITCIPKYCFGYTKIKKIILHDNIETIETGAFAQNLEPVSELGKNEVLVLPKNLRKLGDNAFRNASYTDVVLNEKIEEIGSYALAFNEADLFKNKETWLVPPTLKKLGQGWWMNSEERTNPYQMESFKGKYANDCILDLSTATNLEELGPWALAPFHKIKGSIFPPNIKKIGMHMYERAINCTKDKSTDLIEVTEYEHLPDSLEYIGEFWFSDFDIPITFNSLCSENSNLKYIGNYAFYYELNRNAGGNIKILSDTLILPKTLEIIKGSAFSNQPNIKTVIARGNGEELIIGKDSEGVSYSGYSTFSHCPKLETIDLSAKNIYDIPTMFAYECSKLTSFNYNGPVAEIGNSAFMKSALESFEFHEGLKEIRPFAFAKYGDDSTHQPLLNKQNNVIFPSTLEKLGPYAFIHAGMKGITFNGGVEICFDCFEGCSSISNELILPNTLEYLGSFAFDHTPNFSNTSITIPASLRVIGEGGDPTHKAYREYNSGSHNFYNCASKNKEFIVEEGNQWFTAIDGLLFGKDSNGSVNRLISFPRCIKDKENSPVVNGKYIIPEGITIMDELCFNRCIGITELVLPNSYIIKSDLPKSTDELYEYHYYGTAFEKIYTSYINTEGNTLSVAIYIWHTLQNVTCKEDNPNYKSIDGLVYSKDGKSLWYLSYAKRGNVSIAQGTERIEHGAIFSGDTSIATTSLTIPASVTFIDDDCLKLLNNHYMKSKCTVTIDSANTTYKIANNKIVKI